VISLPSNRFLRRFYSLEIRPASSLARFPGYSISFVFRMAQPCRIMSLLYGLELDTREQFLSLLKGKGLDVE
jgi:hypothetical protein